MSSHKVKGKGRDVLVAKALWPGYLLGDRGVRVGDSEALPRPLGPGCLLRFWLRDSCHCVLGEESGPYILKREPKRHSVPDLRCC